MAYLIGQLGGLIPLPGGLGGVDGGLIGTLVLYGAGATAAATAVLAYRAIVLLLRSRSASRRWSRCGGGSPGSSPRAASSSPAPRPTEPVCGVPHPDSADLALRKHSRERHAKGAALAAAPLNPARRSPS